MAKKKYRVTATMVVNVDAENDDEAQSKGFDFFDQCAKNDRILSVINHMDTHELVPGTPIGRKDKNGTDIKLGDTVITNEGKWVAIVDDIDLVSDPYGGYSASCDWEEFEVMPKDKADEYWKKLAEKRGAPKPENPDSGQKGSQNA